MFRRTPFDETLTLARMHGDTRFGVADLQGVDLTGVITTASGGDIERCVHGKLATKDD